MNYADYYEVRPCNTIPNSMGGTELVVRRKGRSWRTAQVHHFGDKATGEITHRKLILTVAHKDSSGIGYDFDPPAHRWTCEDGDFEALGRFLLGETTDSFFLVPLSPATSSSVESPTRAATAARQLLSAEGLLDALLSQGSADDLLAALSKGARVRELEEAIAQLRHMLDSGENRESQYQKWCERHVWAFGNSYVLRDDVRNIGDGDAVDLLLKSAAQGYRDLIELKTPPPPVLNFDSSHKSWYFSAEVSKVVGQCHRYLDNLHRRVGVAGLTDYPDLTAYHPRATIVIGRSVAWTDGQSQALHGLNSRLTGIKVMTFDHLLQQAEATLGALNQTSADTGP